MGGNTLIVGGSGNMVLGSILSGSGGFTKDGSGTVTLMSLNSYTGITYLSFGTLSIGNGTLGNDGSIASSSGINLENAASSLVYNLSSTASRTYANAIYGLGSLTVMGSGTLTLAGNNTYSGPTLVSGGLLILSNSSALSASSAINDSSIAGGINFPVTGGTATFAGITGTSSNNVTSIFSTSGSITSLVLNPATGVSNSSSGIINDGAVGMNLVKNGSGIQILTGLNTYTGATYLKNGTLSISNLASEGFASGIGTAANASGTAGLIWNGGILQYTGPSVEFNRSATIVSQSNMTQGIDIGANTNVTWDGTIVGGISNGKNIITKYGLGSLTLSGTAMNWNADFIVNSGTLYLAKSGTYAVQGLDINAGGTVVLAGTGNNSQFATSGGSYRLGVINGTFDLNGHAETNLMRLGYNTSGVLTTGTGIITNGSANSVGTFGLQAASNWIMATFAGNIVDGAAGTGKVAFRFNGTGSTNSDQSEVHFQMQGNNTYSGSTTLTGSAVLYAASTTALSPNSAFFLNGVNSGLVLSATDGSSISNNTIGSLSGSAASTVNLSTATLTTGNNNTNTTFAGTISGAGSFTKIGNGTQTLTGTSTYTGTTLVSVGTLVVSGSLSSTSSVSVASAATLNVSGLINNAAAISVRGTLSGTGNVGAVNVSTNGQLSPGATAANGTLTAAGTVAFADSTAKLTIRLGQTTPTSVDKLAINGAYQVNLNGAQLNLTFGGAYTEQPIGWLYDLIDGSSLPAGTAIVGKFAQPDTITCGNDTFNILYNVDAAGDPNAGNYVLLQLASVPEPNSLLILACGAAMLLMVQRARRQTVD